MQHPTVSFAPFASLLSSGQPPEIFLNEAKFLFDLFRGVGSVASGGLKTHAWFLKAFRKMHQLMIPGLGAFLQARLIPAKANTMKVVNPFILDAAEKYGGVVLAIAISVDTSVVNDRQETEC